ncbi:MAG: DinB family protein [Candidatus Sulfotelmatobacter sp.]
MEGLSEKIPLPVELLPSGIKATQPGTSAFQLASLLEQILRATLVARKLVRGRSASELTTRLEPESWSVAECLDHLARTTNAFLPEISKAIAAAPKLASHRTLRTGAIASLLIRNLEPPYRLRYKVIPQLVPQQTDFEAAWSAFKESQLRLSETVYSAAGLAIDKVKVSCPVCAHVTYNAYGAFRMLAAHQRRHLWQVQQILGALDGKREQESAV